MARLLIYDAYENKVYTYANLNENDPMPYSTLTTLRLREFRGKSASPTLWTTIAAMEAWNLTRRKYGRGIPVGYAFRRIWEGGHGTRSQHYAGVAFDVGQSLDQRQRTAIDKTVLIGQGRTIGQQFIAPVACFVPGKGRQAQRKEKGLFPI